MPMVREVAAVAATVPEFSLGALAAVVTPEAVGAVIDACGVREQRRRKLPAGATVFLCVAMNLYAGTCLGQVVARVASGVLGAGRPAHTPAGRRAGGERAAVAVAPPRCVAGEQRRAVARPRPTRRPPAGSAL